MRRAAVLALVLGSLPLPMAALPQRGVRYFAIDSN
jgi:hypothetical protein